ncbi:MAG: transporter [Propionivibrio sp.]|nr:transporter [Propionivibrio sp.]
MAISSAVAFSIASSAQAQEIEPRAYSNAPIGMNFFIGGYAYTEGGVPFDGALPIKKGEIKTSNAVLAYAHVFDLLGQSSKVNVILPYTSLAGTAEFAGRPQERNIYGYGDLSAKLSVNFSGAPALSLKEFRSYQQDLIIGASLQITAPTGQYDSSKLVNLSTNRWSFKPEIGFSKAAGNWTGELQAGATLFTDNTDFFGGNTRKQAPIYSLQGHAIYSFTAGIWGSLDATYFTGGRTTINGSENSDLQQNWRLGGTLAFPVDAKNSVKLYASSGVSARTDNNYNLFGIAWQYRWGGGL